MQVVLLNAILVVLLTLTIGVAKGQGGQISSFLKVFEAIKGQGYPILSLLELFKAPKGQRYHILSFLELFKTV